MRCVDAPADRLEPGGTGGTTAPGDKINDSTSFSAATLECFYRMPAPYSRIDDYYRARHEDLDELTDDDLPKELRLVRRRLDLERDARDAAWLTDRQDAVLAEMARRRRSRPAQSRSFHSRRPHTPDVSGTNAGADVMPSGARFTGGARRVG